MYGRSFWILTLALVLGLVPVYGAAIFTDADLTASPITINFNQFSGNPVLTNVAVEVYNLGGLTVNMAAVNHDPGSPWYQPVVYGTTLMANDFTANASSPYIRNDMSVGPGTPQQGVEFLLAGGAVSSIGIRLAASSVTTFNPIVIELLDTTGQLVIDTFTIQGAQLNAIRTSGNVDPQGATSGFFGFANLTANIGGFRVIGGLVAMDDLKFGGLELSGGGPDPDPDPQAIPEASTFLLCASALALLSLGGRLRRFAGRLEK